MQQVGRADWQHLYKTKQWKQLRKAQLLKHPYCQCPHHKGKHVPANTVDHKVAHKGDRRLFFNPNNLQSLTASCHNKYKQSQERGGHGFDRGSDAKGWPLSSEHFWYNS